MIWVADITNMFGPIGIISGGILASIGLTSACCDDTIAAA